MTTAEIILQQLGGNRFIAMTGAHDLIDGGDHLRMQLHGPKARMLKITLNPSDTYTMEFWKLHRLVDEYAYVYAEDLHRIFTHVTGYDTHI